VRTTTKCFKDQIRGHIFEILDDEYTKELPEQLQNVIDGFRNWWTGYEQKRNPNMYGAFTDWFLGLPSEINVEYRHFAIEEIVVSWFNACDEEYKQPKDESKTYDLYYHLVTREFYALCRLYKIDVYKNIL
jgi:hypothetical protein